MILYYFIYKFLRSLIHIFPTFSILIKILLFGIYFLIFKLANLAFYAKTSNFFPSNTPPDFSLNKGSKFLICILFFSYSFIKLKVSMVLLKSDI